MSTIQVPIGHHTTYGTTPIVDKPVDGASGKSASGGGSGGSAGGGVATDSASAPLLEGEDGGLGKRPVVLWFLLEGEDGVLGKRPVVLWFLLEGAPCSSVTHTYMIARPVLLQLEAVARPYCCCVALLLGYEYGASDVLVIHSRQRPAPSSDALAHDYVPQHACQPVYLPVSQHAHVSK